MFVQELQQRQQQRQTNLEPVGELAGDDQVKTSAADTEAPQAGKNVDPSHNEHPAVTVPAQPEGAIMLRGLGWTVVAFLSVRRCTPGTAEAVVAQPQRGQGEEEEREGHEDDERVHAAREPPNDGGALADLREKPQPAPLAVHLPPDVGVELDELDALGVRQGGPQPPAPRLPRELSRRFQSRAEGKKERTAMFDVRRSM